MRRHWSTVACYAVLSVVAKKDIEEDSNAAVNATAEEGVPDPDVPCVGKQMEWAACAEESCPEEADVCIDCEFGSWSAWGDCHCNGLEERHRVISVRGNHCGTPCEGAKVQTRTCEPDCVREPVDCVLSEWGDWTTCDKPCGGGQSYREKARIQKNFHGGKPCHGYIRQTLPCNTQACHAPEDCVVSEWGDWGPCSRSCDFGSQQRTRVLMQLPANSGRTCELVLSDVRQCMGLPLCSESQDCEWAEWSEWAGCTHNCGGGERTRTRTILHSPRHGGKLCDETVLSEMEACNTHSCHEPTDCTLSEWAAWSVCSKTCNGIQTRTREITKPAQHGGVCLSASLEEIQPCNDLECTDDNIPLEVLGAKDCELSQWTDWGVCSVTCGTAGDQVRSRSVLQYAHGGGKPCDGALIEVQQCTNLAACDSLIAGISALAGVSEDPIDCKMGEWDVWSGCTKTCGGGQRMRQRRVATMPTMGGKPCEEASALEVESCNMFDCSCVPCQWEEWSAWGPCNEDLMRVRERISNVDPIAQCGVPCVGERVEVAHCEDLDGEVPAPVDCVFGQWSSWTECSSDCAGGQRSRTRSILLEPELGGKPCDGPLSETQMCNSNVKCGGGGDCELSEWQAWGACSKKCGGGQRTRHRYVAQEAVLSGTPCASEASLTEISDCNLEPCGTGKKECTWSEWSAWGTCSRTCKGGQMMRSREPVFDDVDARCEPKTQEEVKGCNIEIDCDPCIDAQWGDWTVWTPCSASCGTGFQLRQRSIGRHANHCGRIVEGPEEEYRACQSDPCWGTDEPVDCVLSDWSEFSECSLTCDGFKYRKRDVVRYPVNGGKACTGSLREMSLCNTGKCELHENADCVMRDWHDWSACSTACSSTGVRTRTRGVQSYPRGPHGEACPTALEEVAACDPSDVQNSAECKTEEAIVKKNNCEWGLWSQWGSCSKECGGGERSRRRKIERMPSKDGEPCSRAPSRETESCNNNECYTENRCGFSSWEAWSTCSRSCGGGEKYRMRHLGLWKDGNVEPVNVGRDYKALDDGEGGKKEVKTEQKYALATGMSVTTAGSSTTAGSILETISQTGRTYGFNPALGGLGLLIGMSCASMHHIYSRRQRYTSTHTLLADMDTNLQPVVG